MSEKLLRLYVAITLSDKAPAIDVDQQAILDMNIRPTLLGTEPLVMMFQLVDFKAKGQRLDRYFTQAPVSLTALADRHPTLSAMGGAKIPALTTPRREHGRSSRRS